MLLAERQACSDLYYVVTGERQAQHKWNDRAAELLYEMLHNLRRCSKGFAWMTKFPAFPVTGKNKWSAAFKAGHYIYKVWKEYKKIESNEEFNPRCEEMARYGRYPRAIKEMIILGR